MNEGIQSLSTSGTAINDVFSILSGIIVLGFFIYIALVPVLRAMGLYLLASRLKVSLPGFAFIPFLNVVTFIKTAGYDVGEGLIYIFLRFLVGALFSFVIILFLGTLVKVAEPKGTLIMGFFLLFLFLAYISCFRYLVLGFLYKAMAKRVGEPDSSGLLMSLFPWYMIIIARKNKAQVVSNTTSPLNVSGEQKQSPQKIDIEL